MRIIFALVVFFVLSSFFLVEDPDYKKESGKDIMARARNESSFTPHTPPAPDEKIIFPEIDNTEVKSELDEIGVMVEVWKDYSSGELIEEKRFREGKPYGLHKLWSEGKLRIVKWHLGPSKSSLLMAKFDAKGELVDAQCLKGIRVNEIIDKACGFGASSKIVSRNPKREREFFEGEVIHERSYFPDTDKKWVDRMIEGVSKKSIAYNRDGSVQSISIYSGEDSSLEIFREGKLSSRSIVKKMGEGKRLETYAEFQSDGSELSRWEIHYAGSAKGVCELKWSTGEETKKPIQCL